MSRNFHSDEWIMNRVQEHYQEALKHFPENHIVGIFLQGSQNYGLDTANSDIDTKLIITPTLDEIAKAVPPVSTTYIRENEEHIDFKDVRNYLQTFRKQNLNFLEILYTPYKIINPLYQKEWERLEENRDLISSLNEYRAVHSMKGLAMNKYAAIEHPYPSKVNIIAEHGYDGKQVHHLRRIEDFIERYIARKEPYEQLLHPSDNIRQELLDWKEHRYSLEETRAIADKSVEHIKQMVDKWDSLVAPRENPAAIQLLEDVQYNILKISLKAELNQ